MSDLRTVEFRDGERDVPDYFVRLLAASSIDIHAVTFEEARKLVNEAMTRKWLDAFQESFVIDHLVRYGRWE